MQQIKNILKQSKLVINLYLLSQNVLEVKGVNFLETDNPRVLCKTS